MTPSDFKPPPCKFCNQNVVEKIPGEYYQAKGYFCDACNAKFIYWIFDDKWDSKFNGKLHLISISIIHHSKIYRWTSLDDVVQLWHDNPSSDTPKLIRNFTTDLHITPTNALEKLKTYLLFL